MHQKQFAMAMTGLKSVPELTGSRRTEAQQKKTSWHCWWVSQKLSGETVRTGLLRTQSVLLSGLDQT